MSLTQDFEGFPSVPDNKSEVDVCDSISQIGSRMHKTGGGSTYSKRSRKSGSVCTSSLSSMRIKDSANKAGLLARAAAIKELQKKEVEEFKLRQEKEFLELNVAIVEAEAKERVYAEYENVEGPCIKQLNPQATTFEPKLTSPEVENSHSNLTESSIIQNQIKLLEAMNLNNQLSSVPKPELHKFNGDITQYRAFIRSFEYLISSRLVDETEKLYFLQQYTVGKPREIVNGCLFMPSNEGYPEARKLLEKRYGNIENTISAYVSKVMEYPNLKSDDIEAFDNFSILLINCNNAMKGLPPNVRELDHPKSIRKLLEKFPYAFQDRWRRLADSHSEHNQPITFEDFVLFIEKEVRIMTNSSFGKQLITKGTKREINKNVTTCHIGTQPKQSQHKCLYCEGEHLTQSCRNLMQLSADQKESFIKEKALCFRCLRRGHRSGACRARVTCAVCKGGHATARHNNGYTGSNSNRPLSLPTEGISTNTSDAVDQTNTSINATCHSDKCLSKGMSIIPVKVHIEDKCIETYAFLDNGSSGTFCSEELFEELNLTHVTKTSLSISTVHSTSKTVECKIGTGMKISNLESNEFIEMPPIYTLEKIPVSDNDIIDTEDLQKWPYLHRVHVPRIHSSIGLLIGNNIPKATEPLEVICSPDGYGPYAIRSRIGWYISGHGSSQCDSHKLHYVQLNKISLDCLFENIYQQEFSDLHLGKTGPSVEDIKWTELMDSSCRLNENGHYEVPLPLKNGSCLMNNKLQARKKLQTLKSKFEKDHEFHNKYTEFRNNLLEKGYAQERWIKGSEFLREPQHLWPKDCPVLNEGTEDLETKKLLNIEVCSVEEGNTLYSLTERISSYNKLKRVAAWICRFRNNCRSESDSNNHFKGSLKLEEINQAENVIIRAVQQIAFRDVIRFVNKKENLPNKYKTFEKLSLFICDDGLLRVGGTLKLSNLDNNMKYPCILPANTNLTVILIRQVYEEVGHQGKDHVLSKLRERYWILGVTRLVKKVLKKCVTCRKIQGKPIVQKMADLPLERLDMGSPPFTNTGVDVFGPFLIKRGRSIHKFYGVLFTCLTIRAVHIEIAESLSTDSYINALRRFIARRGQIKSLRSDRGTNFIGAERELKGLVCSLDEGKINDIMVMKGIDWKFNPPYASHFGGAWERQIRTVRKVLSATLREQNLTQESLTTFMCEVESVVNSRPLTILSDSTELLPLTPNHLLTLRNWSIDNPDSNPKDIFSRKRWRQVQYLADIFWKRCSIEYLTQLQIRQKWTKQERELKECDIVLVIEDTIPRGQWKLGRVVSVIKSADGLIRKAEIRCNKSNIIRPISKMVLLVEE